MPISAGLAPAGSQLDSYNNRSAFFPLSIGLAPMEAATGRLFPQRSPSNPIVLSARPDGIAETVPNFHSLHLGQIVKQ